MENKFASNLKKLRQNKNLTQEQVANALNISYQAVSKWENGIANPDLSLIVPLAKLLSVSTDTLLLMDQNTDEQRLKTLLTEIKNISNWQEEGRAKRLTLAKNLISEFPRHFEAVFYYLLCLGDHISYDAKEEEKQTLLQEEERYCRLYLTLVPENRKHGRQAVILRLLNVLCALERREEAISLADTQGQDCEFQLKCYERCLTGDEREIKMLRNASEKANQFLNALYAVKSDASFDLVEGFYNLTDPIPTDVYYQNMITLHCKKANKYFGEGYYDKVMEEYALCAEFAVKIEEYVKEHPEDEPWYSHPMFAKLTGTKELYQDFNPHDMVRVFLTSPSNKVLFERPDHKALVETVTRRAENFDPFHKTKE